MESPTEIEGVTKVQTPSKPQILTNVEQEDKVPSDFVLSPMSKPFNVAARNARSQKVSRAMY